MPLIITSPRPAQPDPYFLEVLADNPIAYWRLDETSGTFCDDQQDNHEATYVGAPSLAYESIVNLPSEKKGARFSGTGQYSSVMGFPLGINSKLGNWAIECWVKVPSTTPTNAVFYLYHQGTTDGSTNKNYSLTLHSVSAGATGFVRFDTYTPSGGQTQTGAGAVVYDTIYHIVVDKAPGGGNLKIYVNNSVVASGSDESYTGGTDMDAVFIGNHTDPLYRVNTSLIMQEVAVYGVTLGPTRIAAHYNAGI